MDALVRNTLSGLAEATGVVEAPAREGLIGRAPGCIDGPSLGSHIALDIRVQPSRGAAASGSLA